MSASFNRRNLLLAGAAGAAAAALPVAAGAQNYKAEYKGSVVGNVPLGTAVAAMRWAELVGERSQGRIHMKAYAGSQLVGGDPTRELVALRQGVFDFTVTSTITSATQIREMNLFSLPFLMPDSRAFDALTQGGPVRAALDATLIKRDAVPLAWSENGFRQVSNSKRPVRRPEDLRGLKIRYAAGQIYVDIYTALGANPLQMSWGDLQPALATGAVDGQETPVNVFLQTKLDAVNQRHLSIWNYVADANIFCVRQPTWATFTKADQDLIRACAEQAAREHSASTRAGLGAAGDRSSLDELARRKVKVEELTEAEKAAFGKATRAVFDKWAATTGTELARLAEDVIRKAA